MGLETEMLCKFKLFFLMLLKAQKFCRNTVDPKVPGGGSGGGEKRHYQQQEKHTRTSKKRFLGCQPFQPFLPKQICICSLSNNRASLICTSVTFKVENNLME